MSYMNWFLNLDEKAQNAYAVASGTDGNYLRTHVFCPMKRRKIPRKKTIERLSDNAPARYSLDDVLEFLYKQEVYKAPMKEAG